MRRIDAIEFALKAGGPSPDGAHQAFVQTVAWLFARVRRLEAALEAAKITAVAGPGGGFYVSPSAYEQNAAIDAALKEDG